MCRSILWDEYAQHCGWCNYERADEWDEYDDDERGAWYDSADGPAVGL
jgi:hypothetical protein